MAGGDEVGAVFEGGFGKELEFDFLVAHDVWIWGVSLFVFLDHVVDDFLLVFFFKIKYFEVDSKFYGDALSIGEVFGPWTFHTWEIFGPVLHVDADNMITLLF